MMQAIRKFSLLLLASLTLFGSCTKKEIEVVNLNNGNIEIIGHGGSGFYAYTNPFPPNSAQSVIRAIEVQNADGVEIDVQISDDGKLFLYHDEFLETQTNCSGCTGSRSSDYLKKCKFDIDFGTSNLENEYLISLEQIISRFAKYNPPPAVYLDVRIVNPCSPEDSLLNPITQELSIIIKRYSAKQWLIIESNSIYFLRKVQQVIPGIRLFMDSNLNRESIAIATKYSFEGIVADNEKVIKSNVDIAHQANVKVVLFNVKSGNSINSAISKNPDGIQTDNIPLLQAILDR